MDYEVNEKKFPDGKKRIFLFELFQGRNQSMRRKLMLYLFSLVIVGSTILMLMLVATGTFSESGRRLEESLKVQLQSREKDIRKMMDFFAGNGIDLSKRVALSLERDILSFPYNIYELENDKEKLKEMQRGIYPLLESKLHITRASGVFAVLDTTVNTDAPGAEHSRSGVYLRLANVSSSSALKNDIFLFRGNSDVAVENRLQIHNRWNMEFDLDQMAWFRTQLDEEAQPKTENYKWIGRHTLHGTWEDGIFLSVPIMGSSGDEVYGLCGLELSSLMFQLSYPAVESKYGDIVTVIAPLDGEQLLIPGGLIGDQGNLSINNSKELKIEQGNGVRIYRNGTNRYYGLHETLQGVVDEFGRQWVIVVLSSSEIYLTQAQYERMILLGILAAFVLIMLLSSYAISRIFVHPIEQGIENLKSDKLGEEQTMSGIKEIDLLAQFLKQKEERFLSENVAEPGLPPDIEELFNRFIEGSKTLTLSERNILGYYIQGHEIADIPELVCVSMNTVRKHNRSIYEKLGVSSKDELQLYLDLLRMCGRIQELD